MRRIILALALAAITPAIPSALAQDSDWEDNPAILACAPQVLRKGGSLNLRMGASHGAELAIKRAGTRDWYFIVTGGPEAQPFMTPDAFAKARRVVLNENTRGYGPPKGGLVKIFTRPGRYVVHTSDKLESEAGGNICNVTYRP